MKDYNCTPQGITSKIAAGVVIINKHSLDWRQHGGVSGCLLTEKHASGAHIEGRRRGNSGAGSCARAGAAYVAAIKQRARRRRGSQSGGSMLKRRRTREHPRARREEKKRDVSDDSDHRARKGI